MPTMDGRLIFLKSPNTRFINYSAYSNYRMEITTIQLSNETKRKLSSFGVKGESYDQILQRIYNMAVKTQLRELLMNSEDTVSLDDFESEIEKKWPKSK